MLLRPVRAADLPRLLEILDEPEVAAWWRRTEWERVDQLGAETFAIVLDEVPPGQEPQRIPAALQTADHRCAHSASHQENGQPAGRVSPRYFRTARAIAA